MRLRIELATVFVTGLVGCATDPASLSIPPAHAIALASPVTWEQKIGVATVRHELASGRYEAAHADTTGTYYRGKDLCLTSEFVGPLDSRGNLQAGYERKWAALCGVFLPVASDGPPKVYVYAQSSRVVKGEAPQKASDAGGVAGGMAVQRIASPGVGPSLNAATAGAAAGVSAAVVGVLAAPPEKGHIAIYASQPDAQRLANVIRR